MIVEKSIIGCIAVVLLASESFANEAKLPTDQEIQGIKNLCAGGDVQKINGNLDAALVKWKTMSVGADVTVAKSNLGAVLEKVSSDAGGVALYTQYISCVQNLISQYLK